VTVLKPSLGYKQCADIARGGLRDRAHERCTTSVSDERKLLTQQKWDRGVLVRETLISPKFEQ